MNIIYNERVKMIATAFNNLGVATVAGGILAPMIGHLYGSSTLQTSGWWFMIGVAWFLVGGGLCFFAWLALGWLKP
jgi:hypothetical protein